MNALTKRKNGNSLMTRERSPLTTRNTFDRLFNSFDDIFDSMWNGDLLRSDIMNNMSTQETDDAYIIHLQALGINKEDVEVNVDGDVVEIKGTTPDDAYIKNSIYYKFTLPAYIDSDNITAKLDNGILKLEAEKITDELDEGNVKQLEVQ